MSLEKTARIKVTAKTDSAQQELNKLGAAAQTAGDKMRRVGDSGAKAGKDLGRFVSGGATVVGGLVATAVGMDRVVMAGARYHAILQNLPFSIDAAAKATQGFISETALMDAALLANRAGLVKNSETFAQFATDVQKVAMSRGQDATEAMDVLTRALSRNETELLDNYGIILKVQQAQDIMAQRTGKTRSTMDEATKASAFMTVGLEKLHEVAEASNTEVDAFTANWMKWKAVVTDAPKLASELTDALAEQVHDLIRYNEELATFLTTGNAIVMQGGRGGGGALGRKLAKQVDKQFAEGLSDKGGSIQALTDWYDRSFEFGKQLGERRIKRLNDALENAILDGQYGSQKGHKKKQEDVILIYDNFWETIQQEIHLKAAESQVAMDNIAARVASGQTRTIDPFARDPQAQANEQRTLNEAMRSLEVERALELDENLDRELERIEIERQAKLDMADFEIRTAEDADQRRAATEERENVLHQARLARIGIEIKQEQRKRAVMQQVGGAIVDVHARVASAAIAGAFQSGTSVKQMVRTSAAAAAQECFITAAVEQIKAIAAFASLNIPQGIAHETAAGLALAQGITFGAIYGVAGGGLGKVGGARGSASQFGLGSSGGGAPAGGGGTTDRSAHIGEGPPISRPSIAPPGTQHAPRRSGGDTHLHIHSTLPPSESQMIDLRRSIARSKREHPGED